jgi:hypothetical protein
VTAWPRPIGFWLICILPTIFLLLQAPLFVIFLVSAIKEGVDDVRRHRADREVNRRPVSVLRHGELQQVRGRAGFRESCVGTE